MNCMRLIDFLEVEHMNHAATENGNLMATYDQLVTWGLGRRLIKPAIREAVFLGLIKCDPGGRWAGANCPSKFRLTYYANCEGHPATNEWKGKTEEAIKAWRFDRTGSKRSQKTKTAGAPSCTTVVHLRALPDPKQRVSKK